VLSPGSEDVRDDRKALERLCVSTRQVKPVDQLLRFVVSPQGVLTPDLKRKLPGRGVWVTATRGAVDEAMRKRLFARSLKSPVDVPADLGARVDLLLERSVLDMLSLANKAGLVVAGFAKVMERIESRRAVAVISAPEGAGDGFRKLAAAARRTYLDSDQPVFITNLSSAHLDLALGRTNVIHAALGAGPVSTGFLDRAAALAFWRDGDPADPRSAQARKPPPNTDDEHSTRDAPSATDGYIESLTENRGDPQDLARNE
jgi:predicted RNA-binding protein YlxR (DUF448 family)